MNIHQCVFHIVANLGDELNAINKEYLEEFFGDIAFVAKKPAPNVFEKFSVKQRFSIINITLS